MVDQHSAEEQDGFKRGYHDIPDDGQLRAMSYIRLSEVFHSCEKDSTKFHVIEREVKRRFAKDQAEINLRNVLVGACVGGIFGLTGVVIGYYLKNIPSSKQITPSSAMQQIGNSNLAVSPSHGNVPVGAPTVSPPVSQATPVQNNAGLSKSSP